MKDAKICNILYIWGIKKNEKFASLYL